MNYLKIQGRQPFRFFTSILKLNWIKYKCYYDLSPTRETISCAR